MKPALAATLFSTLFRFTKDAFLSMLLDQEGLAPATVNRYLALLKSIFRLAVEEELISKSPAKHIRPLLECNERTRFLNTAELSAFIDACDQDENRLIAEFYILLLLTAARSGELLAAKVQDIALDGGVWYLPMTKPGKSAHICLSEPAVTVLCDVIGDRTTGYLFPGKDARKPMSRPVKAFARICTRAGLIDFHPHDLRRTWASLAVGAGIPLLTVSKALRHSSPTITAARYRRR